MVLTSPGSRCIILGRRVHREKHQASSTQVHRLHRPFVLFFSPCSPRFAMAKRAQSPQSLATTAPLNRAICSAGFTSMSIRLRSCSALLVLISLIVTAGETQAGDVTRLMSPWDPDTYPNPLNNAEACGRPGHSSFICDPDGILTQNAQNVAQSTMRQISQPSFPYARAFCRTHAPGQDGFKVLIAVLQSMKSNPPQGSSAEIARAFASILFKSWQYNDVNCQNGALIFFSAAEQQVQLIAPKLDDAARACILQDLTPFVSAQAYDLAVQRAAVDVGFAFKNASTLSSAASS